MGKKYIIEIPEDKIADFVGSTHFLMPYMMAGHIIEHHDTGLPIEPYTEPDLEQIRKEAYEAGMNSNAAVKMADDKAHESYQKGLSDAWEAARKVSHCALWNDYRTDTGELNVYAGDVLDYYTAPEAIKKIRQHEQEQEYHVGDEFENGTEKFVVLKMDGKEIDRYIDGGGRTYVMKEKYRVMRKTGRHFPEIAAVLEKMRGEQE